MKKLIASLLALVFLLACLYTVEVNPCWSGNLVKCSNDDPNEPEPESAFFGSLTNCLDDDPNEPEPEPESTLTWW